MAERRYEPLAPLRRDEAEALLRRGDPASISGALFRLASFEPDWQWVRAQCIRYLGSVDDGVRFAAAESLSDLVRKYPDPSWSDYAAQLRRHLRDPDEAVVNAVERALDDIAKRG